MAHALFVSNGGGGGGIFSDVFSELAFDLIGSGGGGFQEPRARTPVPRIVDVAPAPRLLPAPPPAAPVRIAAAPVPSPSSLEGGIEFDVGFFDDLLDVVTGIGAGVARTAARLLVPDPIESAIQVFFPEVGAQVFGSPLGFPAPQIIPPSFPAVISEVGALPGATPPFLPGPVTGNVTFEDIPGAFDPFIGTPPRDFLPPPRDINDPGFGIVRDEPGIFDDLSRAFFDIVPELIPELFGGGVGGAIAGGIADVAIDRITGPSLSEETIDALGDDITPVGTPMHAEMTIEQWAASGRPSGFCLTSRGTVTRRRRRRRRPLSQQAKDDLAWAKATFGSGKQFDAVVSRMRF